MIRTLQLAGVHGLVSLRLTVSRRYWLPSLTLGTIAGYVLLLSVRDPVAHLFTVLASFVMGCSCLALTRPELTSKTLPIPIPHAWIVAVNVLTQLFVCVLMALGFVVIDVMCSLAVTYSFTDVDWRVILSHPIPQRALLKTAHLQLMALIFVASIPVGLAIAWVIIGQRQPSKVWPNPPWKNVIPRWFGISTALGVTLFVATKLAAPLFAVRYLQAWLGVAIYAAGLATIMYGWAAVFPPTESRVRPGKPAMQCLASTFWHSQAIKWSLMLIGFTLYMLNLGSHLPTDWAISKFRGRPLYILFAALLPLFSMNILTNQIVHGYQWKRSGWSAVPTPRITIQRTFFLDLFGFAAASTLLLHTACLLFTHGVEGNPELTPWLSDLITFTRFFSWATVLALPAWMLLSIPRRRFGLGLAVVTLFATFWALLTTWSHAFGAGDSILAFKLHLMAMGAWIIVGGVFWAQTASPTGKLFEIGPSANGLSKAIFSLIGARATRWSVATGLVVAIVTGITAHRSGMKTEIERLNANRITAEQTDRLIADLQRIHELDILKTTTRTRNAGVVLNPLIGLDDGTPAHNVQWWDNIKHSRFLNREKAHWSTAPDDVEVGDLSILTQLMDYDHWETGRLPSEYTDAHPATGPYEEYLRDTSNSVYLDHFQPYPNSIALVNLAKFRLLVGLRTNKMLPALKEVRHLATLLHSDETIIHTVLAISVLRMERRAFESAIDRGQIEATDWTVPTTEDLDTMHRAAVSMTFVLSGGADDSQWRRLTALGFEPFGLCGAIHDAVSSAVTQPNVRLWPGELLPLFDLGFLDHAISTSTCSNPLARHDHALVQKARQGFDSPPSEEFRRFPKGSTLIRFIGNQFDDSTIMALSVPYLRGNAWMKIQTNLNLRGILMYGETPEDDWNGFRTLHRRGNSAPADKPE